MQPKVSVHILAYNQQHFIRESVGSALAQDYENLEIVVADDASTDETPNVIREYQRKHPGKVVPVLGDRNLGITGNSNRGLAACTGDLISFLGGDDVLLPGKISAQVKWFAENPDGVLCGHQVEVFYDNCSRPPHALNRRIRSGRGARSFIRHGPYGALSIMVRRDRIPAYGFDERMPTVSDQKLWIDVIREDGLFGYVPGIYSRYRRHSANVTNDPLANLDQVERYLDILAEEYPTFRADVRAAKTRRLFYDVAVAMLKAGQKRDARAKVLAAIRREPWFAKAWIRLAQTCL
jgi:glycosyltransferase involved in cell wall biosynthesis